MLSLSILFLALFLTIAFIPLCCRVAFRVHAVDIPDQRKVHDQPIPRCGGIAMAVAVFLATLITMQYDGFIPGYAMGCGLIFLCGLIDDLRGLGFRTKFVTQVAAALVVIRISNIRIQSLGDLLPGITVLPYPVSVGLTLLVIVGVTNAINLSDGLDGLAGGICLLALSCVAYLGYMQDDMAISLIAVAWCGAIFGFLRFNTYPATLFMGDTGSLLLGFSTITLSLALTQGHGALSPLLPLGLLGLPVLDTVNVMIERYREGRPLFSPDKNHFHHKLMRLGFFHTEAVFAIYLIQTAMAVSAFFLRFHSEWVLLTGYIVFAAFLGGMLAEAQNRGWTLTRYRLVDRVVKPHLKAIREKNLVIRASFGVVKYLLPSFLLTTALLIPAVSRYLAISCLIAAAVLVAWWLFWPRTSRAAIITCLYLLIPFVLCLFEGDDSLQKYGKISMEYNLLFLLLIGAVFLTLKLTRRQKGFKTTPTDFLTIFIAFALPFLPGTFFQAHKLGTFAARMVVFFFSFEVLLGELRGQLHWVGWSTIAALLAVGVKGML
jgi:UDP-GlcNAc:undecaprenyl-phosphate/decaprenyl-phosphate GlcNAc-1-phosphate transferase